MSDNLSIRSVYAQDFGGIESFKAELGQVAVVVGANGQGKTSLLQSIHSVLEGGHDPDCIRQGAKTAKVVIELSNGVKMTKTITPKDSNLEVLSPDGGIVKGPATYIKGLVPALSFDPIQFLSSDPKDRAAFLLRTLPMNFEAAEISRIVGSAISGTVNLERFNEIREGQYSQRTELNRQVRDLEGTINDMERNLPADDATDWSAERDSIAAKISGVESSIKTAAAEIELAAEQRRSAERQHSAVRVAALREQISKEEATLAAFLSEVNSRAATILADSTRELEAEKALLSAELGQVRAKADHQQQTAGIRGVIVERKKVLEGHVSREIRLTDTLKALDALKHRKLKELPIAGLDLRMDAKNRPVILIDGIPLDKLNRQTQLFVAIQAVSKAGGRLPLIICECAEIDDEKLAELAAAGKDAGIQMILARWETGAPLEVRAA